MADNILMEVAWRDFVLFALQSDDLKAAYEADTGHRVPKAPTSPLDMMVDRATGYTQDAVMAYAIWVTRTQWGWDEAPESLRCDADKWQKTHPTFGPLGRD